MDGESLNITEEKLDQLKETIPEAFTEGKIDWEKLQATLGKDIEFKNERYVLNWAGKSDAFRVLQAPTTATLVPCKEESVDFDDTEHIFIEGENLEVLKVLQKSYFGKIKMIYIDPPYNTGNDKFIYPDKFSETKDEYLSRIGDKDESGYMTREGLFRKNSKDSGHYHSNWLSMMYPRLFLARNLLREDGVIFVNIDDNESHNLRLLMNEVFGEENFISEVVWKHTQQSKNDERHFSRHFNSLFVYAKSKDIISDFLFPRTKNDNKNYSNPDNDPNGEWRPGDVRSPNYRKTLCYNIITPNGNKVSPPDNGWRWSEKIVKEKILSGEIIFNKEQTKIIRKIYLSNQQGRTPENIWAGEEYGTTRQANAELKTLFDGTAPFETPKPSKLVQKIMELLHKEKEYITLDFFAGTCTLADAVLNLNIADNGNRKFICIQLPEKCEESSKAYKAGYETIAEIGKERIRRVIEKLKSDKQSKLDVDGTAGKQDLGFKVFKLQQSNFKIWRSDVKTEEELDAQLEQFTDPVDEKAEIENILYELLLKSGVSLTAKMEEKDSYFLANDGEIVLMLEKVDENIIKKVISEKPQKVITLDRLFRDNDPLKTNTALQMKDAEIDFRVV